MTIPYNASHLNMRKYIMDSLHLIEFESENKELWYSKSEKDTKTSISSRDISLLVTCIHHIIHNDFEKIKKLMKYLRNIATILTILGLPIVWTLPHGLTVRQSYLETKSTSIRPYLYSKVRINIQIVNKDKYDKAKQVRALMPNSFVGCNIIKFITF